MYKSNEILDKLYDNFVTPSRQAMYIDLQVKFLIDENDSIKAYEQRGKQKSGSQYESGMQLLSGMDRIQQVEMIHGMFKHSAGIMFCKSVDHGLFKMCFKCIVVVSSFFFF